MKKIISVLFICILAMILTSCGNNQINIEDCDWQLQSVTKLNESMPVEDVVFKAQNGEIIIKDKTNKETYKGAYEEMLVTDIKNDYKIIVEGKDGYMSLLETENGKTTLLLTVDGYDLSFFMK